MGRASSNPGSAIKACLASLRFLDETQKTPATLMGLGLPGRSARDISLRNL